MTPAREPALHGLYALLDRARLMAERADPLDACDALLGAGVGTLQLRWKEAPGPGSGDAEFLALAEALAARCRAAGAFFVVNDRVDIAALCGADGVHLGQDDLSPAAARAQLPAGVAVGLSTHSLPQVEAARGAGVDYLGFGPIAQTRSKEAADPVVGLAALSEAARLAGDLPVVAIGGIDLDTMRAVGASGAAAGAVISGLWGPEGLAARARSYQAAFHEGARSHRGAP